MRPGAILFVSRRWLGGGGHRRRGAGSGFAIAGIAVGVAALVVVLGVMNGFQLGYIDAILELSSYHLRVDGATAGLSPARLEEVLRATPGVGAVVPFKETQALAQARDGQVLAVRLRSLPEDVVTRDPAFLQALGLPSAFPLGRGLVVGSELARYLNVSEGDHLEVLGLAADPEEGLSTISLSLPIAAVFHSGYYDFDSGLAFADSGSVAALFPGPAEAGLTWGVKLANRDHDARAKASLLAAGVGGVEGWRDYNRSFFGALRTEKSLMMLLVGLIFLVVGVNIFQGMKRSILERVEELALLKATGAGPDSLRAIFVLDGLAIGVAGSILGLSLGLLIAVNINGIFAAAGSALGLAARLLGRLGADFSLFSPRYFYLMEVPVRLLFPELLFIVASAMAASALSAAAAARRIASLEPAELLRYE